MCGDAGEARIAGEGVNAAIKFLGVFDALRFHRWF